MELAVQVHVEQTVSVEYESQDHESDHHRKPSNAWDFPSWPVRYLLSAYIFGSDIIETSFRLCLTWPIIYGQGRLLLTGPAQFIGYCTSWVPGGYRSIMSIPPSGFGTIKNLNFCAYWMAHIRRCSLIGIKKARLNQHWMHRNYPYCFCESVRYIIRIHSHQNSNIPINSAAFDMDGQEVVFTAFALACLFTSVLWHTMSGSCANSVEGYMLRVCLWRHCEGSEKMT